MEKWHESWDGSRAYSILFLGAHQRRATTGVDSKVTTAYSEFGMSLLGSFDCATPNNPAICCGETVRARNIFLDCVSGVLSEEKTSM
jgi:hypothetical protein